MRLIDADTKITALLYDEEHEETNSVEMTIADFLDSHTEEGCPQNGCWTSVKERLPEEHADEHPYEFEQFLCSTVWDDVRMVGFGTRIGDDKPHFWSGNSIWDDWVTHWMPKPKPAKEGKNAKAD